MADYLHNSFDLLHSKKSPSHEMTCGRYCIDMDAFYASVEEQDRPDIRQALDRRRTSGRGVVAAASYAVRRFGVRSAMPMREALRRCPQAVCVAPRMARYKEVSEQVFAIFHQFTPLVEGLSLDEAFLDVTSSQQLLGSAESMGREIRGRIQLQTGLTASVGIAPNKLLAKIASDLNKPDGMCRLDPDNAHEIIDGLPVEKLFGIGPRTLPAVHAAGIRSFGGYGEPATMCCGGFGKHGEAMRARAAGLDDRPVEPNAPKIHQCRRPMRPHRGSAARRRNTAAGRSRRLAIAGAGPRRRQGEPSRSAAAISRPSPPTSPGLRHPGHGGVGRGPESSRGVVSDQPNAPIRLLGVGWAPQYPAAGTCSQRPRPGSRPTRPSTASATVRPSMLTRQSIAASATGTADHVPQFLRPQRKALRITPDRIIST